MQEYFKIFTLIAVVLLTVGCKETTREMAGKTTVALDGDNPFLQEWVGPYGGVPAFDEMELEALKPALETGMTLKLGEIDRIVLNPDQPNFKNTIVALERTGRALNRVLNYYSVLRSNLSTPRFREIEKEMAPRLAEFNSKIIQNRGLFERIEAVYKSDENDLLRPDQQRLVWLHYNRFKRHGATLEGRAREHYVDISRQLAVLYTRFANNVLADEENYVLYLNENQLGGLSESYIQSAAVAAASRGHEGRYAITNTRSSMSPFLTFSDERQLREKVWRTYYSRGDHGDGHDNKAVITEILELRNERAKLLGYENFAEWQLENKMAKTPAQVSELMQAVWPAALSRVKEEVADMQEIADREGAGIRIEPWDYRYYAEKVRNARYELDSEEVQQYLQLEKIRDAMFFVAREVFDLTFTPVPDGTIPVFHEDVKVWEVSDSNNGDVIGLWYFDPFARTGKSSGAWASTYRDHERFDGEVTILASNNTNFIKGTAGQETLISWNDAVTMFHEFGHALHFLSSRVEYPTLNGAVRDFIEFPSQLLERWLLTDRVIDNYFIHVDTGEPMPEKLVARIKEAATFNRGFSTTEYLASALMDMKYHTTNPSGLDVTAFEKISMVEMNMPEEIVMRHRSTQFGHIFNGEGYAAGYYSYLWADVLTSDAAEAFEEAPEGFYDEALASKLVSYLLAVGNSVDPAEAYRAFRGRDAGIGALMRDRGF